MRENIIEEEKGGKCMWLNHKRIKINCDRECSRRNSG